MTDLTSQTQTAGGRGPDLTASLGSLAAKVQVMQQRIDVLEERIGVMNAMIRQLAVTPPWPVPPPPMPGVQYPYPMPQQLRTQGHAPRPPVTPYEQLQQENLQLTRMLQAIGKALTSHYPVFMEGDADETP